MPLTTIEMKIRYELDGLQEKIDSIPANARKTDLLGHLEELSRSLEIVKQELLRLERKQEESRTTFQWFVGVGFVIYTFVLTSF